ncbi:hypothetical protein ABXS75_02170 [Roseburia hominis]
MGFFGNLFSRQDAADPLHKYFAQQEKLAWKWPCKEYEVTLGVYINGTLNYTDGTMDSYGGYIYTAEKLPDKIDRQKAIELCRAAMDPVNVRATKNKFGQQWDDPHFAVAIILAVISTDESERDQCIREIIQNSHGGLLASRLSYYLYYHGLLDKYCPSLREKLQAYYRISQSPALLSEEREGFNPVGLDLWKRDTLYCGVDCKTRRIQGREELKKLLLSGDRQISTATANFLQNQWKSERGDLSSKIAEYYEVCQYMQDELDCKFVDRDGYEVVLENGQVHKIHR